MVLSLPLFFYNVSMISIIHHTDSYVVCIKPAGISSQQDGLGRLLSQQLNMDTYPVHRLDQAVSGLIVYALTPEAAGKLSQSLTEKKYLAIIEKSALPVTGTMEDWLYHDRRSNKSYVVKKKRNGVRSASLEYEILNTVNDYQLVEVSLHTGRTHQIRVQFASRKCPLCGDGKYGSRVNGEIMLYSHHLSLTDPDTEAILSFDSLPERKGLWELFL